jgi:hypothetical protein
MSDYHTYVQTKWIDFVTACVYGAHKTVNQIQHVLVRYHWVRVYKKLESMHALHIKMIFLVLNFRLLIVNKGRLLMERVVPVNRLG